MSIPAGVAHIVLNGTSGQGENWAFGHWVHTGTVTDQAAADAVLSAIGGQFNAKLVAKVQPLIPAAARAAGLIGYFYTGGPGAAFVSHFAETFAGTGSGSLPMQTSLVVSFRSGVGTRSGRGRAYLPAFGKALGGNQFDPDEMLAMATAWKDYFNALNSLSSPIGMFGTVVQRRRASRQTIAAVQSVTLT